MAALITENFEGGTHGAVINSTNSTVASNVGLPTFTNAGPIEGALCADFDAAGAQKMIRFDHAAASLAWYSFYVWSESRPAEPTYLASFFGGTNKVGDLRVAADGTMAVRDNNAAVITTTTALTVNAWNRVALRVTPNGTLQLRMYVGANLHGTTPDYDGSGNSSRDFALDNFRVGVVTSGTWHLKIDRVRADSAAEPAGMAPSIPTRGHILTPSGPRPFGPAVVKLP